MQLQFTLVSLPNSAITQESTELLTRTVPLHNAASSTHPQSSCGTPLVSALLFG